MSSQSSSMMSIGHRQTLVTVTIAMVIVLASAVFSWDRMTANLLMISWFLVTIALGGALLIALTTVCGAGWIVAFRRVPEALTGVLPVAGALVLMSLAARLLHAEGHGHAGGDPGTFWFKEDWLSPGFMMARAVVYLVLWILGARILVGHSRSQDAGPGMAKTSGNAFAAVVFIFVYAITFTLASIDWIMALEPMWFSTIWGVYQFSGMVMTTLAVTIIACILLRRSGPLADVVRDDHLHDLAKLLLGFSCFWMYIWFSQYMLIWYSNLPEETSYFITRVNGPWGPIVVGTIVLNWIVPFFVLLPKPNKTNERILMRIAVVVLIGRWTDLYVMIFPPLVGERPVIGLPEVASIVAACGILLLVFTRSFAAAPPVPRNDPLLAESLHYHA
jgi:hypothetical protein